MVLVLVLEAVSSMWYRRCGILDAGSSTSTANAEYEYEYEKPGANALRLIELSGCAPVSTYVSNFH
jgi:hypothetical protein